MITLSMSIFSCLMASIIHSIIEFLPISSSFFLKFLNFSDIKLFLHAMSGVYFLIFFLMNFDIKLLSLHFIYFFFVFFLSIFLHLIFIKYPIILFILLILLIINTIISYIFKRKLFYSYIVIIYILIIILMSNCKLNDLYSQIIGLTLFVSSLIFNQSITNKKPIIIDAFILGSIVCFSQYLSISRLGIIMTYFLFRNFNLKDVMQYSFLISGCLNLSIAVFLILNINNQLSWIIKENGIRQDVAQNISQILISGAIAAPIGVSTLILCNKYPKSFICISVLIRVFIIYYMYYTL